MGRIADKDRLPVVDGHIGHWNQADQVAGAPITVNGMGVADLQTKRDAYHAKQLEIEQAENDLEFDRAQRTSVFGQNSQATGGVWFHVKLYKRYVQARIKKSNPLGRTVPNIGRVTIENYESILHRFLNHWTRVNAALGADLTLGDFTLAQLQAAHDQLVALALSIETAEQSTLPTLRAEREQMFGDEAEEERADDSIITLLLLYHTEIEARFAGEPIADSLPDIFPDGGSPTPLPTVPYDWVQADASTVNIWVQIAAGLTDLFTLHAREGTAELSFQVDAVPPGQTVQATWVDVVIVDEVDEVTLRDSQGRDIARGVRDTELPNPGP